MKHIKSLAITGLLLSATTTAFAVPKLQLDIDGGFYVGGSEESVMTTADSFSLYALAAPKGKVSSSDILADTYYLSIAITPAHTTATNLGSFTFNGLTINATDDMRFGTPLSLPSHGIYDAFYYEHAFKFDALNTVAEYNVEDNAGGPQAGNDLYSAMFNIDINNLSPDVELHFDLYNKKTGKDKSYFAPFSHDAGTTCCDPTAPKPPGTVPAPASLGLILLGLMGLNITRRRLQS